RDLDIATIADLPVGKNLQDHLLVPMQWARRGRGPFHATMRSDRIVRSMLRAYLFGNGPGTVIPSGLHAFLKTRPDLLVPDIEFLFRAAPGEARMWFPGIAPAYDDAFTIAPVILHPESRGEVQLRSAD